MRNQNFLFVVFCLVLTMGLMQGYFAFQEYFSPHKENLKQIAKLKGELERQHLKVAELESQVVDFQQEVAAQLPALEKLPGTPKNFQIRNLASITQKPLDAFEMSGPLSERAKSEFRKQDFVAASKTFKELTEKFPTSPQVVEAYFFWAESLFLSSKPQECLDVVEQMLVQYPSHELTGFILLRMGQILQSRNRGDEAKEVYRSVAKSFSGNVELKRQAEQMEKSVQ